MGEAATVTKEDLVEAEEISKEDLMTLVNKLREEHFLDWIEPFEDEHSQYFDPEAGDGDDHEKVQHEIYDKFQKLFAPKMEEWLSKQGHHLDRFMAAVDRDRKKLTGNTAEQLLSGVSYESFVTVMLAHRERLMAEEHYDLITSHRAP